MPAWKSLIFIFLGGGLGATSRFGLSSAITFLARNSALQRFPLGILACNLLGCLLLGCVFGLIGQRQDSPLFAFLVTGFLGGFTTFSTFSKDSQALLSSGLHAHALANIAVSVFLGIGAVYVGYRITAS